jgi:hypothetical protein
VIPSEPDFGEIGKLVVGCDISGRKMIVIIENWLRFRILVIEPLRRITVQQKIVVNKGRHGS